MKKYLIINSDFFDIRLDKWLKINFSLLNQSFIEKNIRKGNIKINGKKTRSKDKLKNNDEVFIFNYSQEIYINRVKSIHTKVIPSKYTQLFEKNIIYENNFFIILNKWTGIASQGGSKINISIDHIIKNISEKYNLVHRLDRETSGLLIIAKDLKTTKYFGNLFKRNLINKTYIASCEGVPKNTESEINLLIASKKDINKKSETITRYKVYQTFNKLTNIIFSPQTGKTHQIRIVAKHLGCPIVGDTKYNSNNKFSFEKLKLNAHILKFVFNDQEYTFISELPEHFKIFLKKNNLKKIKLN